jgi:hypothetical protein
MEFKWRSLCKWPKPKKQTTTTTIPKGKSSQDSERRLRRLTVIGTISVLKSWGEETMEALDMKEDRRDSGIDVDRQGTKEEGEEEEEDEEEEEEGGLIHDSQEDTSQKPSFHQRTDSTTTTEVQLPLIPPNTSSPIYIKPPNSTFDGKNRSPRFTEEFDISVPTSSTQESSTQEDFEPALKLLAAVGYAPRRWIWGRDPPLETELPPHVKARLARMRRVLENGDGHESCGLFEADQV